MAGAINKLIQNKLFKSSLIYSLTDSINKSIPFFLLPLLTHYLSPADYGISTNYTIYTSILLIIIGLGVQSAISSIFYSLKPEELRTYISNCIYLIFITFFISLVFIMVFSNQIKDFLPISTNYLLVGSVVALGQAITAVNMVIWQLEEKAFFFGGYQISQTIFNVGLSVFFLVILGMKWDGRVDALVYTSVLFGFISLIMLIKRNYFKISKNFPYFNEILMFCLPLIPHSISMWIRSGVDRVIITNLYSEAEVGLYATGFQFGLLLSFLLLAFNQAFTPFLYKKLNEENPEILDSNKIKLVKLTFAYIPIVIFLAIILIFVSNFIIDNFLAQSYYNAKEFIPWIIFSQVFQGLYFMVGLYIFYVKKTGGLAIITFLCSLIQIFLSYFFIKKLGSIGGAYSTFAVSVINFVCVAIYSMKVYPMPWFNVYKKSVHRH